jgi:hypothetical protein
MTVNSDTSAGGRIWLFYPGPKIVVRSDYIETREARYPVRDLIDQRVHYFDAHIARAVALYCGLIELLLGGVASAAFGSPQMLLPTGAVAALGLTGAIWTDYRRNPRWMELIAWHEGRPVVLFATSDKRVFEQVRRAVRRAREVNQEPRP